MRWFLGSAVVIAAFGLSVAAWQRGSALPPPPPQLALGALPANLWVEGVEGGRFELGALRGKPTVLLFFRGAG